MTAIRTSIVRRAHLALCAMFVFFTSSMGQIPDPAPAPSGFVDLFNGQNLDGWDGDPTYWRVENGCIVGEITPKTLLKRNSFLIWRGGQTGNGELIVEYRVSAKGNSGINYHSTEVADIPWALAGYQADIDGEDQWSGQIYEERGRGFLAYRGQKSLLPADGGKPAVSPIADRAELQKVVHKEDWNTYHIIMDGRHIRHFINGVLMSEIHDFDLAEHRSSGLLGVQVHTGPPMKIEFRAIRYKAAQAP